MRLPLIVAFMASLVSPVLADEVPFAAPPPAQPGSSEAYLSSLSDVMGLTQLRHIKLWYAGRARNWALTNFELGQIEDTFGKAAMYYRNIPVEYVVAVAKPLDAMRKATQGRDPAQFSQAYTDLTNACNACHQAAQVGFVVIQTPTSSPFTDQKFEGAQK